ncbi:PepSY domain-containing protein [Mesorhizobium comanense]|uniref:PepSY domain-containing protein n=1 Tax=Mesorhizobium comanense TaxID=2502215 RepID=UPI0010F767B2|nr:PepSY domain-containing protein [Mesorhizobium comanense]
MRIILASLAATATLALASPAFADDSYRHCGNVERTQWMSVSEISAKAEANGLTVREVDRDNGCYEIKGLDATGQRVEVTMHPVSGEVIETETETDD